MPYSPKTKKKFTFINLHPKKNCNICLANVRVCVCVDMCGCVHSYLFMRMSVVLYIFDWIVYTFTTHFVNKCVCKYKIFKYYIIRVYTCIHAYKCRTLTKFFIYCTLFLFIELTSQSTLAQLITTDMEMQILNTFFAAIGTISIELNGRVALTRIT